MKLVNTLAAAVLLTTAGHALGIEPTYYQIYESKVSECVAIEKSKTPVQASDLAGIDRETAAVGIFYLKDKRIVDCSATDELRALAHELLNKKADVSELKHKYMSIDSVEREQEFSQLAEPQRHRLVSAVEGKSLEVDLVSLFDELDARK
ncbi:hypothetical protein LZP73_09445 [Shewanella sp. AS16]|uniref:hypothetical protein n=1 Tax=Shewanella sp. AS16 TaxID=2907625 RepID=UPI001F2B9E3A|nr:hypothetical protein [Shewanella sp. AS16]MCE9686435.1 hypothetical protein [Shewanella sp. AS16]